MTLVAKIPQEFVANERNHYRLNLRHRKIIDDNIEHIRDKRVLDLACSNGRWTWAAADAGAKHVTAVEGRAETLAVGREYFAANGWADRATFIQGDMYEYLPKQAVGSFDTIFCLGVFYHIMDHYMLVRQMTKLKPKLIIIDSGFSTNFDYSVWVHTEDPGKISSALPVHTGQVAELVGLVSLGMMIQMALNCGYHCVPVAWDPADLNDDKERESVRDYLRGRRYTLRLEPQETSGLNVAGVQDRWRSALGKLNPKWADLVDAPPRPSYEELAKKNRELTKQLKELKKAR